MTTRDEVLAMAREAGISESQFMPGYIHATMTNIERLVALSVAPYKEDAERFKYLQNLPVKDAQAFFWNYTSRKQRAAAIDKARSAK